MTVEISREKVEGYLKGMNGKMVSIDFRTKDGAWRTINGRLGVTRYTSGGINPPADRVDLPYVVVWETPKPQQKRKPGRERYRNLNLSTIEYIRGQGQDIIVV